MLVKLDDEVLFEIDERMVKLLAHDLQNPLEEIKRRLRWVIEHKCDRSFVRISQEWLIPDETGECKLSKCGVKSIPSSKTAIADLVFNLPEYKNRLQRDELSNQLSSL